MSDINDDAVNEDDEVSNILSFKTAKYLALFLLAVIIIAFVVSFVQFQIATGKGEHAKYFWVERNMPNANPDTVFKDRIIYMDTVTAAHDSIHHDTVYKEVKAASQGSHAMPRDYPSAAPAQNAAPAAPSAPPQPDVPHHLTDEDKSAIIAQIEGLRKVNNIASMDIEISHVYRSNAGAFIPELEDFLRSKGYKPDSGNGSRMIFGKTAHKSWWVALKPETRKIMIGVGMF